MNSCFMMTMGKLSEVNGNVAFTMDKLSGIRGDLVRHDDNWQSWDLLKLCDACDALKSWTRRNPLDSTEAPPQKRDRSPSRVYNATRDNRKPSHVFAFTAEMVPTRVPTVHA